MNKTTKANTVVIAGAGIGGMTLALALARKGMQVKILEKAKQLNEVGAGLQLSANAVKVLRFLQVDQELKPYVFAPQYAALRHYRSGNYYLKSPLGDTAEQRYGAPYWHIHRADLHRILTRACQNAGVAIELNQQVEGYRKEKGQAVLLMNNGQAAADVVVGADGLRSVIRDKMLGIQAPIFSGQVAWRGTVAVEKIQNIKVAPDATVWAGPGQHFVSYYLRGGRLVNFVAVEERAEWQSESWRQEGDVNELRRKFAGWHPEVTEVLNACEETFIWALNGRPTLPKWSDERVVLLGDACHPMLPFMAQGAAMAIEDAYVLAQALQNHPIDIALAKYESLRKPRATMIQQISAENAALYHMHGGWKGRLKLQGIGLATGLVKGAANLKLDKVYGYDVTEQMI